MQESAKTIKKAYFDPLTGWAAPIYLLVDYVCKSSLLSYSGGCLYGLFIQSNKID